MQPDFSRFRGTSAPRAGATMQSRPRSAGRRVLAALASAVLLLAASGTALAEESHHTVYAGQTLGKIAKRYRVTVDALREANGLKPGEPIHPGDVLVIPERSKPGARGKTGPNRPAALRREADRSRGASAKERGAEARSTGKGPSKKKVTKAEPAASKEKSYAKRPKRPGWVRLVRGNRTMEFRLLTPKGRLVPAALPKLRQMMQASPTASIPIDPRLATLIGMVSNHFGGRTIRIVSGYRPYSPTQYTPHSNHNYGRAIDFIVEGVPNTVVRDFCRTFRNAGVGYYPNSTFVHLDVRSEKAYWVDYSGPGEPPRYAGAKGSVAPDEAARDVPLSAEEEVYGSEITRAPQPQAANIAATNPAAGRGGNNGSKQVGAVAPP